MIQIPAAAVIPAAAGGVLPPVAPAAAVIPDAAGGALPPVPAVEAAEALITALNPDFSPAEVSNAAQALIGSLMRGRRGRGQARGRGFLRGRGRGFSRGRGRGRPWGQGGSNLNFYM